MKYFMPQKPCGIFGRYFATCASKIDMITCITKIKMLTPNPIFGRTSLVEYLFGFARIWLKPTSEKITPNTGPTYGQQQHTIGATNPITAATFVFCCDPTPLNGNGAGPLATTVVVATGGAAPVCEGALWEGEAPDEPSPRAPNASLNSSNVRSGFHAPSSNFAIVSPFARPCAIHSKIASRVTGPYSR